MPRPHPSFASGSSSRVSEDITLTCAGCEIIDNDIGLLGDGALFGNGAADVEQQKLGDFVPVWRIQHQHPQPALEIGKVLPVVHVGGLLVVECVKQSSVGLTLLEFGNIL